MGQCLCTDPYPPPPRARCLPPPPFCAPPPPRTCGRVQVEPGVESGKEADQILHRLDEDLPTQAGQHHPKEAMYVCVLTVQPLCWYPVLEDELLTRDHLLDHVHVPFIHHRRPDARSPAPMGAPSSRGGTGTLGSASRQENC